MADLCIVVTEIVLNLFIFTTEREVLFPADTSIPHPLCQDITD
jgi:hypothetical protein